jgi:hypothetical protein
MKTKLLVAGFLLLSVAQAEANDQGAWVKVDASGNATGGAIVCTPDVCGDSNSPYAKATLAPGERYVLQFKADPVTNNVAGIGNNNPGVAVKVDIATNNWTVAHTHQVESPAHPTTNETVKVKTTTVQTFNPITQPTPVVETTKLIEREVPVVIEPEIDWQTWWENWLIEWSFFGDWLNSLFDWANL